VRRAWAVGLVALALVATTAFTVWRQTRDTCGAAVTSMSAADSRSPFLDATEQRQQPDTDRDALAATLARDPAPIGEVVGAVGYHYEQWAQVSAYAQGLGVRTRDNPDFTMLDERLRPRWSVQVDSARSTYDASDRTYLVATLPKRAAPTLVALDADTGRRRWCQALGGAATDVLATQLLADDDVVVLAAGRLVRLHRGEERWSRRVEAGQGDFVGVLRDGVLLAGGTPRDEPAGGAGTSLVAVSAATGRPVWDREVTAGTVDRVVGTDPASGTAVVEERTPTGSALLGLDAAGKQLWQLPGTDAAIRSGRLLTRTATRWSAHDPRTGRALWSVPVPTSPQFLPYGYQLDQLPLLDEDHALVGSTTALRTLDLRDGSMTSAALPVDGISTTYWPYQLAVTGSQIAVVTNTGAVVVRRDD
jgi:hypothetical protein